MFVGKPAPDFTLKDQNNKDVTISSFKGKKNLVILFYPLDWTPVWSLELPACHDLQEDFESLDTQVLGISVDSVHSHKAFGQKLKLNLTLLSDFHRDVSKLYGVYLEEEGISARATFIVDKKGIIRYQLINDIAIKRDEKELIRVLKEINHGSCAG